VGRQELLLGRRGAPLLDLLGGAVRYVKKAEGHSHVDSREQLI